MYYILSHEKNENNEKEAGLAHIFLKSSALLTLRNLRMH